MPVVLICAPAPLPDLRGTLLWRDGVERHVVHQFSERLVGSLVWVPSLIVVTRDFAELPPFIAELRRGAATHRASIAIVTQAAAEPEEAAWLAAGANQVLRLPAGPAWDDRLSHLMDMPVRRDARLPVRLELEARAGVETVLGVVLDLSARGMLVECPLDLALGAELDFWLGVAVPAAPVIGRGRVVRLGAEQRYGVEFSHFEEDGRDRMQRFVDTGGTPSVEI